MSLGDDQISISDNLTLVANGRYISRKGPHVVARGEHSVTRWYISSQPVLIFDTCRNRSDTKWFELTYSCRLVEKVNVQAAASKNNDATYSCILHVIPMKLSSSQSLIVAAFSIECSDEYRIIRYWRA